MRFFGLVALASLALVNATPSVNQATPHTDKQLEHMFTSFIRTHNKNYTHDNFFQRYATFKTNVEKIRQHNLSGAKFTMGMNEFADQTWEEFRATRLGYKHVDRQHLRGLNAAKFAERHAAAAALRNINLDDDAVDWRSKNAVTGVKDQGQCGSCWSFSTTGSVEGAVAIATGTLTSLSEQQLIDCSTAQGNQGCNGGLMDDAFQYIITNKGLTTEASYPYTASGPNSCQSSGKKLVSKISSYQDVPASDEDALLKAVQLGPVSVAIEADQEAFQFYSGGVLTATCGKQLDHGVLVVGYGTDSGSDYWIVKNSWGATWGESGYIRLVRGQDECGLADAASYPIV